LGITPDVHQYKALESRKRNQFWLWGRQTGKSFTDAILSMHQAVMYAGSLILILSASLRQSAELFKKIVDMYYRLKAPPKRTDDSQSVMTLANDSRIICLPGTESTVRGYSAPQLVILDEAAQCPDPLYHAVRPMLLTSGGKLVLSSSAFAKVGFFWEIWRDRVNLPEWEFNEVKVDECPRVDRRKLEEDFRAMGGPIFDREYNNVFMAVQGGLFTPEDIEALTARAATGITAWNLPDLMGGGDEGWKGDMIEHRWEAMR